MIPAITLRGLVKPCSWTAAVLFLLTGPGILGADDWQSLRARPPFGERAASMAGGPADWEFRGVVQEDGDLVNLYNPAAKTSRWIPVPGRAGEVEVTAYDASSGQLRIIQSGRPLT